MTTNLCITSNTSKGKVIERGERLRIASVSAGKTLQTPQESFFPRPSKDETVSQPVRLWHIGRALNICIYIFWTIRCTPIQRNALPQTAANATDSATTSVSIATLLCPRFTQSATCMNYRESWISFFMLTWLQFRSVLILVGTKHMCIISCYQYFTPVTWEICSAMKWKRPVLLSSTHAYEICPVCRKRAWSCSMSATTSSPVVLRWPVKTFRDIPIPYDTKSSKNV